MEPIKIRTAIFEAMSGLATSYTGSGILYAPSQKKAVSVVRRAHSGQIIDKMHLKQDMQTALNKAK